MIRIAAAFGLVLMTSSCLFSSKAASCIDACRDDGEFFAECWDALAEAQITVDCYLDLEEFEGQLYAAATPEERQAVRDAWRDAGLVYPCADADEVEDQCIEGERISFDLMLPPEQLERQEECRAPDQTEIGLAMATGNCDAVIEMITGG